MTDNTQNEVSRTGAGLDLDGIEARCDKATPAPWVNFDPNAVLGVDAPEGGVVAWTYHRGNTNFIAHARTDIPALLDALARAEAHAERLAEGARAVLKCADDLKAWVALGLPARALAPAPSRETANSAMDDLRQALSAYRGR